MHKKHLTKTHIIIRNQ